MHQKLLLTGLTRIIWMSLHGTSLAR